MKHFILLTFLGTSILFSDVQNEETRNEAMLAYITEAVTSVEDARQDALIALDKMVDNVDNAREKSTQQSQNSISTQIVETHALGEIAKSTADVEIAKAKAIAKITKAVDAMDNASKVERLKVEDASFTSIMEAVTSVEIAKANASKNITEATQRVEIAKTQAPKHIEHEKETLSIAKNIAAVQIAKSVADVEVARSNSMIEIAYSSMNSMMPSFSEEDEKNLKEMKAKATANISTYMAELEVLKAEIVAKIANEVAKVEVAESQL